MASDALKQLTAIYSSTDDPLDLQRSYAKSHVRSGFAELTADEEIENIKRESEIFRKQKQ